MRPCDKGCTWLSGRIAAVAVLALWCAAPVARADTAADLFRRCIGPDAPGAPLADCAALRHAYRVELYRCVVGRKRAADLASGAIMDVSARTHRTDHLICAGFVHKKLGTSGH